MESRLAPTFGRVPVSTHRSRPWRIHAVAAGMRLEDAWQLPVCGDRSQFTDFVDLVASYDTATSTSSVVRFLFDVRWKLGSWLGWDAPEEQIDARVPSLREKLPRDLRRGPTGPQFAALPFRPLYLTADEFAAEIANKTMHGVMHLGWVPDAAGSCHAEIAVYVATNGWFGDAYMAAIKPFRYVAVYPALGREMERLWSRRQHTAQPTS